MSIAPPLSTAQKNRIRELRDQGLSAHQIAEIMEVNGRRIAPFFSAGGVVRTPTSVRVATPPPSTPLTAEEIRVAQTYAAEGMSVERIADTLGRPVESVREAVGVTSLLAKPRTTPPSPPAQTGSPALKQYLETNGAAWTRAEPPDDNEGPPGRVLSTVEVLPPGARVATFAEAEAIAAADVEAAGQVLRDHRLGSKSFRAPVSPPTKVPTEPAVSLQLADPDPTPVATEPPAGNLDPSVPNQSDDNDGRAGPVLSWASPHQETLDAWHDRDGCGCVYPPACVPHWGSPGRCDPHGHVPTAPTTELAPMVQSTDAIPAGSAYGHGYRLGWMAAVLTIFRDHLEMVADVTNLAGLALDPPDMPSWPGGET